MAGDQLTNSTLPSSLPEEVIIYPGALSGSIQVPCSKSLAHRALILAGLAQGVSHISALSLSKDISVTARCLEALGADVRLDPEKQTATVTGTTIEKMEARAPIHLDAYESGSTLRFFIPVAAVQSTKVRFTGQPSLLSRPMGFYADLFLSQGLFFDQSADSIQFQGPLQPGLFSIPGNISSQFISGLLMAAPLLSGASELAVLPPYQSRSYVSLTVDMMKKFGVDVKEPGDHGYIIEEKATYHPCDLAIESDYSQAAFFAAAGALKDSITLLNLNPDSLQGDKAILHILQQAGARIEWPDETTCKISSAPLHPFTADLADCPDLGPILCVLAAYIPGKSRLVHASRLRYKECDRIDAMEKALKAWNVDIESDEDSITIHGKSEYSQEGITVVPCANDHRIIMAMSIFGALAKSPSRLNYAASISKSYPLFFEDFRKVHGKVEFL